MLQKNGLILLEFLFGTKPEKKVLDTLKYPILLCTVLTFQFFALQLLFILKIFKLCVICYHAKQTNEKKHFSRTGKKIAFGIFFHGEFQSFLLLNIAE